MDEATTWRHALIWHLVYVGALHDAAVRDAMLAVPRHLFLPTEPLPRAYLDDAIPTKHTAAGIAISSASQPTMVAQMLEQLALVPGMRVLEIGAGTGYNAALMRTLVGDTGHITTIDIDADLTAAARAHLASVGITDVETVTADGAAGYAVNAPYDRVILTVGTGDIAPAWIAQLAPDGVLVLPLSIGTAQYSIAFARQGTLLWSRSLVRCGFMPLRGSMDHTVQRFPVEDEVQVALDRALATRPVPDFPGTVPPTIIAVPRGDMSFPPDDAIIIPLPHWELRVMRA